MLRAIIFDFDGVICESVQIKMEAFRRLFEQYPDHLDNILDYHMANGGISRFEKFKVIYRDFLNQEITSKELQRLGDDYTRYSYEAVVQAPLVSGGEEFLKEYFKKVMLFVASGTPEVEMRSIVKDKKVGKFFRGIYGSPLTKHELVLKILKENRLDKEDVILKGPPRPE